MSIGNTKDNGNKGNNFPYQLRMLQLLDNINTSINAIPGVDFVTRTTSYQATCSPNPCGPGYSAGDILVRYDIIDVATSTITTTIWFNQTTGAQITPDPIAGSYIPITAPSTVFIGNGPGSGAVYIQDGGNSITVDGTVAATQSGAWILGANSGVDIGDVTINNGNLANAVNIQDGGNSITVDGTLGSNTNDGVGNPITSTVPAPGIRALDVNITNATPLDVNIDQANDSILIYGFDGSSSQRIATSTAGVLQVDILSIPTVTVTGTVSANISGSISNTSFEATQAIAGNLNATVVGTGTFAVQAAQSGTWNINSITNTVNIAGTVAVSSLPPITGSVTVSGTVAATQSGTWNINNISGIISLPTGAATQTTLANVENNVTSKIDRIRGAANYSRVFTYYGVTNNVATIVHTGTTNIGPETLTETFTYVNNSIDGSNVVSIIYS